MGTLTTPVKRAIRDTIRPEQLICPDCEYVSPVSFVPYKSANAPAFGVAHSIIFVFIVILIALFVYCFIQLRKPIIDDDDPIIDDDNDTIIDDETVIDEEEIEEEEEEEEEEIIEEEIEEEEEEEIIEIVYPVRTGTDCLTFFDSTDRLFECPLGYEFNEAQQTCIGITETGCVGALDPFVGDQEQFNCDNKTSRRSTLNACQTLIDCASGYVSNFANATETTCLQYFPSTRNFYIRHCHNVAGCRLLGVAFVNYDGEIPPPRLAVNNTDRCNNNERTVRNYIHPCKTASLCIPNNPVTTRICSNVKQCIYGDQLACVPCNTMPRCAHFDNNLPMQNYGETL
jgi:hypothetical protein